MELKEITSVETKAGILRCIALITSVSEKDKDKIAWKHSKDIKEYFKSIDNKMNIQNIYAMQQNPNEVITFIRYYV